MCVGGEGGVVFVYVSVVLMFFFYSRQRIIQAGHYSSDVVWELN